MHPLDELQALSRTFGAEAAGRKLRLLAAVAGLGKLSRRRLLQLRDTLAFLRAHPDDPAVLARIERTARELPRWAGQLAGEATADTGLPGAIHSHPFSYAVCRFLVEALPDCVEIDWDDREALDSLHEVLASLIGVAETPSLDDVDLDTRAWLTAANPRADGSAAPSPLAFVLDLFAGSGLEPAMQATLFESCGLSIRYALARPGTERLQAVRPPSRVHYQRADLDRGRWPLGPRIRRPLPRVEHVVAAEGRAWIDLCMRVLCARNLEIYPLSYGDATQVRHVSCGRGIEVVLIGVPPGARSALESLFFFAVVHNGVPIAYGPVSLLFGCVEMGINLFPEFRGGEIRVVYAEVMRVLYHVLGVRYFSVPSYGMGIRNEEALASGAFWFYRKLGFRPTNPEVEALARSEEERMQREPGYRSDRRTLRRLAPTEAYLDLSAGECRPLDSVRLGLHLTRRFGAEFAGDRAVATRRCERQLVRDLAIADSPRWSAAERAARRMLAPLLTCIPDLATWSTANKRALVRVIRAKAAPNEIEFANALAGHPTCERALRRLLEA